MRTRRFVVFTVLCFSGAALCLDTSAAAPISVSVKQPHLTIDYAASELVKYIGRMAGDPDAAVLAGAGQESRADLQLGLFSDFKYPLTGIEDPDRDDAIRIDVKGSKGIIAGSNARSVLIAAYRFLEANGCRWLRPGADGEIVPRRTVGDLSGQISDKAFYRFRGNNNCCTYSLKNMLDKIEWAPKAGLNTFFNEFLLPRSLYNNYYGRRYPSLKNPEPRPDEEIWAFHEKTVTEIKRRGLFLHGAGHGWAGIVAGTPESESDHEARPAVPPGKEKYLALLKGKRDMSRGPTFTELCYGNPEVRQLLARAVADYAARHPEMDYVHVWAADGMNNDCECELCRATRPSDSYVASLNAIDEELTRRRMATRIVFLAYGDLLWPPEKERFRNPGRFTMMLAPARTFRQPYDLNGAGAPLPPYVRNGNTLTPEIRDRASLPFFHAWRRLFTGEAFTFDYHFIDFHFFDPGHAYVSDIMAEDIRRLDRLGISGYVSCQNVRAFFPTGYPIVMHAQTLWYPGGDTGKLSREYFEDNFGKDGQACLEYLKKLSVLFDPASTSEWGKMAAGWTDAAAVRRLVEVPSVVEAFRPVIERNLGCAEPAQAQSWRYLKLHADFAALLSRTMRAKAEGRQALADAYGAELTDFLRLNEDAMQPVFDLSWFTDAMARQRIFRLPPEKRGRR